MINRKLLHLYLAYCPVIHVSLVIFFISYYGVLEIQKFSLYIVLLGILIHEWLFPYHSRKIKKHTANDVVSFIVNILILSTFWTLFVRNYYGVLESNLIKKINNDLPFILQVTLIVIFIDLLIYITHRLQHIIPLVWRFHRVHHSVPLLRVINGYYFHPIDYIIGALIPFSLPAFLGVDGEVLSVALLVLMIPHLLAHSNIKFEFPNWYTKVFYTNFHHRWHHSTNPDEYNRNFGGALTVWDHLFGTYYLPKDKTEPSHYGLAGTDPYIEQGFLQTIFKSFKKDIS